MITGLLIVQYLLKVEEVVDGGTTGVQVYILTANTTINME